MAQKTGQPLIDSLTSDPAFSVEDSNKVKALNTIAGTLLYMNPREAFPYTTEALTLSKKLGWKKGIANTENTIGLLIGDTGDNTAARQYFEASYALNKETGNRQNQVRNLNNIARSYNRQSRYAKGLDFYLQALTLAEELKDNALISLVCTGLSASYFYQENWAKSKLYSEMTISAGMRAGTMRDVGTGRMHLGDFYLHIKDSLAAMRQYDTAYHIFKDLRNNTLMATALAEKAVAEEHDLNQSLEDALEAQKTFDLAAPRGYSSMMNLSNIGVRHLALAGQTSSRDEKKAMLAKAENYLDKSLELAKSNNSEDYVAKIYQLLSGLSEAKGDRDLALDYYKRYNAINDSIFSQEKKNELAELQGKHDLELKDKEIAISRLETSDQRKTKWGFALGVIFLSVVGAMFFRQSTQRKKINTTLMVLNGQLDDANKIKARFFGILSHDLRAPVASLLTFLQLMKEEPELLNPEDQAGHRQEIGHSAEELLETIETMLLWSKEQMDSFKPDIRTVPVAVLFSYLEKFFSDNRTSKIVFDAPEGITVTADENYLKVIMQNLTSNALKALHHSPAGLIRWQAEKSGDKTILSITDNGPGLNAEQTKALFNDGAGVNARSGFGFHLVRDLAKAIRYTISVESAPGAGTTFTLAA